jgi:hypothetical protein
VKKNSFFQGLKNNFLLSWFPKVKGEGRSPRNEGANGGSKCGKSAFEQGTDFEAVFSTGVPYPGPLRKASRNERQGFRGISS